MDANRQREITYRELERLDQEQALQHKLERLGDSPRHSFAKDDRRSSARVGNVALTPRERAERWPLG
jgi:hypothetical protein